ncbi:MAG TPA: glycosyltransferase family 39 protein, partial [Candidatus Polarisedimenticolia bacterium]|nr:glycosyltransferase family 39 protein [Candidatus Polarisedimenticolia bacterium]
MTSERRGFAGHPLVLGGLLVILLGQMLAASRLKSPTFDEPAHIGAGFSYLKTGQFKVNLQHPPLLKEIGALPLLLIGARWPMSEKDWEAVGVPSEPWVQWSLGEDVIFGNDASRVMFSTRLPFMLLTVLLGILIYAWGRKILGRGAAAGALLLFALDPTIVAHGQLVAMDVGFAAFGFLFLYALWSYLNHRSLRRLLGCGLALGAALATKFSAVVLLPLAAILVLAASRWIPEAVPRRPSSLADPYASDDGGQRIVWCVYAIVSLVLVAAVLIYALYFFPANPFLYVEGMQLVNADHDASYWPYMAGHFQPSFWTYYAVAYLLKEPIPTLLLVAFGILALLRRGAAATLDRVFLLLPPALLFLVHALFSHNLGFRYVIPALPFLYLVGGAGLRWLWGERSPWRRVAAVTLCAWLPVGAAGIYPDHLSYFNELACLLAAPGRVGLDGGTRCGPLWLDDSNVDWGQGMLQLKSWLDRNAPGRPVRLAYFGSMRPEMYGLTGVKIGLQELEEPARPGLYAVSAHLLARAIGRLSMGGGGGEAGWLLRTRPT